MAKPQPLCPAGLHDMVTDSRQLYTKDGRKNGRECLGCKRLRDAAWHRTRYFMQKLNEAMAELAAAENITDEPTEGTQP